MKDGHKVLSWPFVVKHNCFYLLYNYDICHITKQHIVTQLSISFQRLPKNTKIMPTYQIVNNTPLKNITK